MSSTPVKTEGSHGRRELLSALEQNPGGWVLVQTEELQALELFGITKLVDVTRENGKGEENRH
ncbi:hypothetical protein TRIUR3_25275 [Triticum urartu]|uniref:Uncharacterized protein n=1 Tax=Triticum urartu TaxID=4572 RepID=M7YV99_TRIUA|nr:hypothetical protein TRIUR3_25275 [Triticum urartu]